MCWNATVSLNTFLFSMFVLLLIVYNNKFTEYKIQELNNIWIYLFLASFIFMQLIEFFIWRNIKNKFYNHLFSTLATFLIFIQPIFSIMILSNKQLRNKVLISYLLCATCFYILRVFQRNSKFMTKNINSSVSDKGHLVWNFFELGPILLLIWLFFLLFSLIYEKKWIGLAIGIILLCISYITYMNDNSMGSMWCWMVNLVMFYYAFYLLFYLPFISHKF